MVYNESYEQVAQKIGNIRQYGMRYERVEKPGYVITWSNNSGDWYLAGPVIKGTTKHLDCNTIIVYGTKSHVQSLIDEGLPVFFGYENSFEFSKQGRLSRAEREGRFVAPKNAERGWKMPVAPAVVQKVVDATEQKRQKQEELEQILTAIDRDLGTYEHHMTGLEDDIIQARTNVRKKVPNFYERVLNISNVAQSIREDHMHIVTPMIIEQAKDIAKRSRLLLIRVKEWEAYSRAIKFPYAKTMAQQHYRAFLAKVRGTPTFRRQSGATDVVPVNRILKNIKSVTTQFKV